LMLTAGEQNVVRKTGVPRAARREGIITLKCPTNRGQKQQSTKKR